MHVLVIGGTGFIGYHIVQKLRDSDHEVSLLTRNPTKAEAIFGSGIHYHKGDLNLFRQIDFDDLFKQVDTLIYAAGIDERESPQGDPYAFFYKENVTTCLNVLEKAKERNVKHAIILGSMFTHLSRLYPELELDKHHAYIRSRAQQLNEALNLADDTFQVNIAEIPFVFGSTPGHGTIWKNLINYIRVASPLVVTPGGANVISVESVAEAICGIAFNVSSSGPEPVGDENMTWSELLTAINKALGQSPKNISLLKNGLFKDLTKLGAFFQEFFGMQSGLDHHQISHLIIKESFYPTDEIKERLGYSGGDLEKAFRDTIEACPQSALVSGLQKSMDWLSESALQTLKSINKLSNSMNKK